MQPDLADQIRKKHEETGWGRKRLADFFGCTEHAARVAIEQKISSAIASAAGAAEAAAVLSAAEPTGKQWVSNDNYTYNDRTDTYVTWMRCTPKPVVVPGVTHRAMKQAYSDWDGNPATLNEIARRFEFPRPWLIEYKKLHGWTHDSDPFSDEEILSRDTESLVDDALQARRQVLYQRFESRKWQEVKAAAEKWWNWDQHGKPQIIEYINGVTSGYGPASLDLKQPEVPFAVVYSPFNDLHYGKYGSPLETRSPYNRAIATERVITATQEVIRRVLHFGAPQKWIVPIGSDLTHIDNARGETTRGTRQDTDGTYREIRIGVNRLVIQVLDLLLQVAPIQIILNEEGNHDTAGSLETSQFVAAWYRNDSRVIMDDSLMPRKHIIYGQTMITFDHGDKCKPDVLIRKMAQEARDLWSASKYHMALVAHLHQLWMTEIDGVLVCRRPCLSSSDNWHEGEGYTGNKPAVAAYIIDAALGPTNQIFAPVFDKGQ